MSATYLILCDGYWIPVQNNSERRVRMKHQGSVTVEASLVIPLFLFTVIAFFQMGCILVCNAGLSMTFSEAVADTAQEICKTETAMDGMQETFVYPRLYSRLRSALKEDAMVEQYVSGGGSGILLTKAGLTEDGFLEAAISCTMQIKVPVIGCLKMKVSMWQRQKAYVGYMDTTAAEAYVYVTDHQSVYHVSRACTHLKLSISEVTEQELKHSYTGLVPCSFCKNGGSSYYVTGEGDCYHRSLACPGLKRTVYRVKKSSVPMLKPCSRCGG